jgi:hypothetical protein
VQDSILRHVQGLRHLKLDLGFFYYDVYGLAPKSNECSIAPIIRGVCACVMFSTEGLLHSAMMQGSLRRWINHRSW